MRRPGPMLASLVFAAAALATQGCGSSNAVWVSGTLLKGGAAYTPPSGQAVSVTFVVLDAKDDDGKAIPAGQPYPAEYDAASSTFAVPGPDRSGIPRGKYRVAVTQKMLREAYDAANAKKTRATPARDADTLNNRYGLDTSPILREVTASTNLVLDLDRPGEP